MVPPAFMEGKRAINNSIVIMAWPGMSHRVRGKKGRKEMGRRNAIAESEEKRISRLGGSAPGQAGGLCGVVLGFLSSGITRRIM